MNLLKGKSREISGHRVSRRRFLSLGLVTVASGIFPLHTLAAADDFLSPERSLSIHNLFTGEELNSVYWSRGKYIPESLDKLNFIFRDFHNGIIKPIDKRLLDFLFALQQKLRNEGPLHIISGYRSPKTNAFLKKQGKGVARNSLHMYGKAVDMRLPGYKLRVLRRTAIELQGGGVGYYPRADFVHLDVGRVRYWSNTKRS